MKFFFLTLVTLLTACQHKSMPVITDRKAEKPNRVFSVYAPPGTVVPDAATGKILFGGSCNRCHGLPELNLYKENRWEGILLSMIPKTKLTEEEAVHVRAYVLANAAK